MYHFIINPKSSSGKGIRYWWTVKDELDKQQISYTAAFTKHLGHATELARQICNDNDGIKDIVILGGDGTFNEVLNGIDNYKEVLLGYIPTGSSNDFARSLMLPKDPVSAIENILKPKKFKYLDIGIITFPESDLPPRKFACNSGIGYDANICNEVQTSSLKKHLNRIGAGKFVYFAIGIKQMIAIKPSDATIIVDGIKKDTFKDVLLVSNMIHKYEGGGLLMAPQADPCDGKLSVTLVHGVNPLRGFLLMPTIFKGKHINFHKYVKSFRCSDIEIFLDNAASVHTDGEIPIACSHIKVSCIPEQIRMIL